MPLSRRTYEIAACLVALAMLAAMLALLAQAKGLLLANGQPLFGDFITFWSAGRAAIEGDAALVHDRAFLFTLHEQAVPGVQFVGPWNSPPQFLLIVALFGTMPYPVAGIVFLAATGALYIYAAHKLLPDTRALIFAVTAPAALYHLGTVQSGLHIAGISALALYWLDARPRLAGGLVALLAIKPHLAIVWPLMLALTGRWRAFGVATLGSIAFAVIAGWAFGFDAYVRFFENLSASQGLISGQHVATPAYASLYASALGLGLPQAAAIAMQALSATGALIAAIICFRSGERTTQGAALCAATLLVSPYLFFYDFTLLAVGAALLGAPRDRFETIAAVFAWGAGLSLALGYIAPLPLCPLAAWLVLAAALKRAGSAAPRPAPEPHT
ncbi:MAG: DUF2029 domain-containing protein [Caulobacterales bacterium]|nr:DUF2029 domain-containing protein [Caulobacterales bacterium]